MNSLLAKYDNVVQGSHSELGLPVQLNVRQNKIKSESIGAPGRCATCYRFDFNATWQVK